MGFVVPRQMDLLCFVVVVDSVGSRATDYRLKLTVHGPELTQISKLVSHFEGTIWNHRKLVSPIKLNLDVAPVGFVSHQSASLQIP